ncbi:MAG TPA: hypothetical protein VK168_09630 [Saprospiraceae bacterium]|nr:hypothetical protein [Saprospiraceae bacterium]
MKTLTSLLMLVAVLSYSCTKEEPVEGFVIVKGRLIDSQSSDPVSHAVVKRLALRNGSGFWPDEVVKYTVETHATETDEDGMFELSIPRVDAKNEGIILRVEMGPNIASNVSFYAIQETVTFDWAKELVEHNMAVKLAIRPIIVLKLQDDPNINILPANIPWRCLTETFRYSGPTQIVSFAEPLTPNSPIDTMFGPETKNAYISWKFKAQQGNNILYSSPIDSMVLDNKLINEYTIYY